MRAGRRSRHTLEPLDRVAVRALLARLLEPVELVPEEAIERIVALTQGIPFYLVEVAEALRLGGALRQRPSGGWYLASEHLEQLATTPLADRLASRILGRLSEPLVALALLCAVLGEEVAAEEVARMQAALDGVAAGGTDIDAGVGLERLARAELLEPVHAGRSRFRHRLLQEAVLARTPPALRRRLHEAAFELLRASARGPAERLRLARHAAGAERTSEAAAIYLHLAESARRAYRDVEADQRYTTALELFAEDDLPARRRALEGRGRVRYRIDRRDEALADLAAARALAERTGDRRGVLELALDEVMVLDWCEAYQRCDEALASLADGVAALGDPMIVARYGMRLGVAHVRMERWGEAVVCLEEAARAAGALGDDETAVIALLLLAPSLVIQGRLDEAERHFESAVLLCEARQDLMHLAATLGNRIYLWIKRLDEERARADAARVRAIAAELGNAELLCQVHSNMALFFFCQGDLEPALAEARRARALDRPPGAEYALLIARIAAACGDVALASEHCAWIRSHIAEATLSPSEHALLGMVEGWLPSMRRAEGHPDWAQIVAAVDAVRVLEEAAEVRVFAAAAALELGDRGEATRWLADARRHASRGVFAPLLARLAQRLSEEPR